MLLVYSFITKADEVTGTPVNVREARAAKLALRTHFALADALKVVNKYNLIEKFRK